MRVRSQVKRAYNTAAEEDNNRKESLVYWKKFSDGEEEG